nr:NAD-dependent epimerase/dehydratase family protein [uncultured Sphaerochaeta sp.]
MMRKAVVTGATSMIGVALVEECIRNDTEVLAVVRNGSQKLGKLPKSKLVSVVECDLENLDALGTELGVHDTFYHFAWSNTSKETRDDPILQYENIGYTLDAVKLAARLKCHTFIGAGSQAEYGFVDGRILPDAQVKPLMAYGIAKFAAGQLSCKLCDALGMVHVWGRVFSVYGINDNEGTMIKYALQQYKNGRVAHFSAGLQKWNYLFEGDAGRIFYLLGVRVKASKVYNIASLDTRPLCEYIQEIKSVLGEQFQYDLADPSDSLPFGIDPDTLSLFGDIDYIPQMSFSEGMRICMNHCTTNKEK